MPYKNKMPDYDRVCRKIAKDIIHFCETSFFVSGETQGIMLDENDLEKALIYSVMPIINDQWIKYTELEKEVGKVKEKCDDKCAFLEEYNGKLQGKIKELKDRLNEFER